MPEPIPTSHPDLHGLGLQWESLSQPDGRTLWAIRAGVHSAAVTSTLVREGWRWFFPLAWGDARLRDGWAPHTTAPMNFMLPSDPGDWSALFPSLIEAMLNAEDNIAAGMIAEATRSLRRLSREQVVAAGRDMAAQLRASSLTKPK